MVKLKNTIVLRPTWAIIEKKILVFNYEFDNWTVMIEVKQSIKS